jgi:hypothetical protein
VYPVGPNLIAGLVAHPFAAPRDVLRFYRDFTESLPDELTAFAGVLHAPDGSGAKIAVVAVCYAGSLEAGEKAVAPIRRFGSPVMDVIGPGDDRCQRRVDAGRVCRDGSALQRRALRELSER